MKELYAVEDLFSKIKLLFPCESVTKKRQPLISSYCHSLDLAENLYKVTSGLVQWTVDFEENKVST